ncbi:hypothetical protein GCM10009533_71870 [Saccharopolyspora spinosporotrichia]|uniref:Uncharacterized protein n=1 Tax=Saccharopolyspora erythraea TaxID=1836 RepID=A0ABN1EG48_SACER
MAPETWCTGMFSYVPGESGESRARRNDRRKRACSGGAARATDGRFGTNPIAFGFPSTSAPVTWYIGTAAVMYGEVVLATRLGADLRPHLIWVCPWAGDIVDQL